ncbi:purine-cytosine permease family protein [Amycolatopsis cihanbeyliensis]|uniref:NCS1 family nucleobase:cation symporter-1 n=1 Tax=Amycolatopsis cihanbeyliensis TaxID=1128664 RepID=A0A542DRY9_AMYCI|nr:cytosine permease [Amycolatopsis cihanbeyliensis]TQJ05891.1 NCS1 family nucleobase:cation symporter-1 [Amycolatopsis cihanbeyliensis]
MTPADHSPAADPAPPAAGRVSGHVGRFTELPVLRHERIWGFWQFTSVNVGLAIATWAFLTGGTIAMFAGVRTAIAATVIGNLVGVVLMAAATCLPSARYGVEQYTVLRTVFGLNGVRTLIAVMMPFAQAGWNAVLAVMFGRAVTNVLNSVFGTTFAPDSAMVVAMSLLALFLAWLIVARGPVSIEWVNKIVAPLLAVLTVVMLIALLRAHSWTELSAAQPVAALGDDRLNFTLALELSFATGFSWWTIMGNLARLTTTPRTAFWPNMIGLFAASVVAGLIGTFAALALGEIDPTMWMVPLGGVVLGVLALLFIAFANVTSMVAQTYSGSLAVIRAGGSVVRRIPWPLFVALMFLPSAVVVFWPTALYDNFFKFIAWVGLVMAPLTAVYLVDFVLLRSRTLWLRDLYEPEGVSRYSFWWGFNPAAFLAVAAGAVTYSLLLNPVTFSSAGLFTYTSASLPAFLVTAAVHTVLTVLWVRPAGKGGYREAL